MSRKTLLVTNKLEAAPNGGRELLCKLNYELLLDFAGRDFYLFELEKTGVSDYKDLLRAFRGEIDGLDKPNIQGILDRIRTERVDCLFIDGSNLGALAKHARLEFPELKIVSFFHNVEAIFFWDAFKHSKSLRAAAVLLVNYLAERKAVRYSSRLICLSERDSRNLRSLYGRQATDISAMAVKDTYRENPVDAIAAGHGRYALFVGGVFFANLSGILWYAEHVAPNIGIKTLVVGRGFEQYKDEIERWGNIAVIGGVDGIAPWYSHAELVVAPIFGGSGMKTKVAEALMFGKIIIGTPEAFSGYESLINRAGFVCESADDFIAAAEAITAIDKAPFNAGLRELYMGEFNTDAAKLRLQHIMQA